MLIRRYNFSILRDAAAACAFRVFVNFEVIFFLSLGTTSYTHFYFITACLCKERERVVTITIWASTYYLSLFQAHLGAPFTFIPSLTFKYYYNMPINLPSCFNWSTKSSKSLVSDKKKSDTNSLFDFFVDKLSRNKQLPLIMSNMNRIMSWDCLTRFYLA